MLGMVRMEFMILSGRSMSMEVKKMNQLFPKGEYVRLKKDYPEENRNFRAGQRFTVVGHDAFLVVVSVLGYRFSILPGLLESY